MQIHALDIGSSGHMEIRENTAEVTPVKFAELWLRSDDPISVPNLKWLTRIDGVDSTLIFSNFTDSTSWQQIGLVYLDPSAESLTWHIEDTGTSELGGEVDFEVPLFAAESLAAILINDNGVYKRAIPYIKDAGVWKPATAFVKKLGTWRSIT